MLPEDQKNQTSIDFKTSDYDFQTLSETIGWDFEAFIVTPSRPLPHPAPHPPPTKKEKAEFSVWKT